MSLISCVQPIVLSLKVKQEWSLIYFYKEDSWSQTEEVPSLSLTVILMGATLFKLVFKKIILRQKISPKLTE